MKIFIYLFCFLFLSPFYGSAQTTNDSVTGIYNRHLTKNVGMSEKNAVYGKSSEKVGYSISTSDQELILEKNHCAALTVKNSGNYFSGNFMSNPQVYYGVWKMSGDTVIITYTKTCCELVQFTNDSVSADGLVKLNPSLQNKYFWTGDNFLEPVNEDDKTIFYKGELEVVE